jgi:hypothetical protein
MTKSMSCATVLDSETVKTIRVFYSSSSVIVTLPFFSSSSTKSISLGLQSLSTKSLSIKRLSEVGSLGFVARHRGISARSIC